MQAIDVRQQAEQRIYRQWIKTVEAPAQEKFLRYSQGRLTKKAPLISIVLPTYNTEPRFLHEAIQSLIKQRYAHWQLCIIDDASDRKSVRRIITRYAAQEPRIEVYSFLRNKGIASASNRGIDAARGEYLGFLDHDDVLPSYALEVMALYCIEYEEACLLYSDSDSLDDAGQRCDPFFKPNWNYERFLCQNYLNHFCLYKTSVLREVGGLRQGFQGSQDFDLALRVIETIPPAAIMHVPFILYHWRTVVSSVSRADLKRAAHHSRIAVAHHLQRTGQNAKVTAARGAVIYNQVKWQPAPSPSKVAVLVFGSDAILNGRCVQAIKRLDPHRKYLVIPLLVGLPGGKINIATVLDRSASMLNVDVLCFFYSSYLPCGPESLEALIAQAQRPTVGAVSAKCIVAEEKPRGYFACLALDQQVEEIYGACFATSKKVFDAVGGLANEVEGERPMERSGNQNSSTAGEVRHGSEISTSLSVALTSLGRRYSQRLKSKGMTLVWSAQATVVRCSWKGVNAVDSHQWSEPLPLKNTAATVQVRGV